MRSATANIVLPLGGAQDHKRAFDGDTGPNTGGMGAYSPAPVLDARVEQEALARILEPTVAAMRARGSPYRGVLYAGLMITSAGPKLIEFNCRFGDPECQVLMPRLKSDLLPALIAARDGILDSVDLRWSSETALCVVMAAKGYPGAYAKGTEIKGLDRARHIEGVEIFHAGTTAGTAVFSPMVGASWIFARLARTSSRRRSAHIVPSQASIGRTDFAAAILAGGRSPANELFSRRMLLALSLLFLVAGLLFFRHRSPDSALLS